MSALDRETHSLQDIFRFVFTVARHNRTARKLTGVVCLARIGMWRRALLAWFAKMSDEVVLSMYLDNALAQKQPPVSESFQNPDKRKYVIVSAETKWKTLEDARTVRTVPSVVLALRSDSAQHGCHPDAADAWMRKDQSMYWARTCMALANGASHAMPCPPAPHTYIHRLINNTTGK